MYRPQWTRLPTPHRNFSRRMVNDMMTEPRPGAVGGGEYEYNPKFFDRMLLFGRTLFSVKRKSSEKIEPSSPSAQMRRP